MILWSASGQSLPNYKFHTYSPEDGYYYDGVKSIQQDDSGFIWVLMDYDLYRFDGYQHVSYYTYFQNMEPATTWKFNNIATDTLRRLYVVANNKLFVHHANSSRFECLLDSTISFLQIDSKNRIWLKMPDLYLYIPESNQLVPMMYNQKPVPNISTFWDDDGQLYAVSKWGTVYKVDAENGIFTLHDERLPRENLYNFIVWKNKTIWACDYKKKLHHIDGENYKIIETYHFLDIPEIFINCLYIDDSNYVWIGTRRGLYLLNPQTSEYSLFQNNNNDPFTISDNSIWTINEDRQQNIWLGTYSGGLCYVNPNEKKQFKSYTPVNHRVISGFAETGNELWIATEGGGISVVDKKTGNVSYKAYIPNENSLAYNNVKTMATDSIRENIWISMFQGGLDCYNLSAKKFIHYKNDSQNVNSLRFNDLRTIALEPDSGLWIAYQNPMILLSFFSFEKKTFEHFSMTLSSGKSYIFDICRDLESDDLWMVTHQNMYRMNVKNKNIEEIPSSEMINGQTLCVDADHNVWIGTMGKGLFKYSVKNSSYSKYDNILKFKVSTIYSIRPDRYGYLWLGTDNGLFRFDSSTGVFMQFTKDDGIQGRVFYPLASMQSSSGELYFGGTSGYTVITDLAIRKNTYKPKAMISDILIDNISILFDTTLHVHSTKTLTITHNQANIGFLLSSDNYLMPAKNRFKYRLVGYDDRWVETDASNRYAFYTKLPAGNYTFELIASNNDGLWGDTPLQMNIRRLPAPWLSVWAYLLYSLVAVLALFVIVRYYYRQKQLKIALYMESMEKRQREEIHQSQLSFFTNISHELKTPLSLILAVADTLRKEGVRELYFRILNNNAQRLLHLVNELMLFRTVESGKQSLNLEMIDVNDFIKNIAEDFTDFAHQHDFHYDIQLDKTLSDHIPADRMILEKIVTNLLNNALRYTPDGGSISISTYSCIRQFSPIYRNSYHTGNENVEDPFYIVVHDTGVGISEASISKIFERFYKIDTSPNQHLGSGIGLALVKSLVILHKGSISVYSEREKGAEMVVALSKNAASYHEQNLDEPHLSNDHFPQHEDLVLMKEWSKNEDELYLRENKRLLIAEDNEELRKLMAGFLSQHYDIVEASDGVMASNLVRDMEIDLIISDIMMPYKDGITLCNEIKTDINSSHIPVILLTAKTGTDSKLEGVESGADIYLEKPFNFDILLQMIRNIFKRQEMLKEYYARHYFTDSGETPANRQNNAFLKKIYDLLDACIDNDEFDVNYIASELMMSKTKLYTKLKSITGKSLIEIVRSYRLRKAARMMIEEDISVSEVITRVGIESQSYFTRVFKKEFGETPTAFVAKNKKGESSS